MSGSILSNDMTLLFIFKDVQVLNQKLIWAKIEFWYVYTFSQSIHLNEPPQTINKRKIHRQTSVISYFYYFCNRKIIIHIMKESIVIKNLGPLKHVEIDDIRPLTVFIGKSASGKSTIMKVVVLMR